MSEGEYTKDSERKLGTAPILGGIMAMQEITFSADSDLLDRAEQIAKAKGTTLEEEVRRWLDDFGEGRWKLAPRSLRKRKARKSVKD
jgi:hypothetical protein